jgi:glycosyltransferase involved in cell wall biosynthesis
MPTMRYLPRVTMIQDGARLHYAVPLALQQAGLLERMYSDWFVTPHSVEHGLSTALRWFVPGLARRMADRQCAGLDHRCIARRPWLALYQQLLRHKFPSAEAFYAWCSDGIADWVLRCDGGSATALFGFIRNIHPKLCEAALARGVATVADQIIAPARIEKFQLQQEFQRWPGWQPPSVRNDYDLVDEFERRTWSALSHITCGSDYVRQGLIDLGVAAGRITVLPYPIHAEKFVVPDRSHRSGPLLIGFIGSVGLRKGAPYFLQVAQRLATPAMRFVMVGPLGLKTSALADLRRSVELVGPVPRSQVLNWLRRFDVFLFPSTCEGSATAVAEAMACGLPVVTSPESGTLIRDGREGFLCAYDDVDALESRITQLANDKDLRLAMGHAARRRAEKMNLESYSAGLAGVFEQLGATASA